jgi:hypothetical protein
MWREIEDEVLVSVNGDHGGVAADSGDTTYLASAQFTVEGCDEDFNFGRLANRGRNQQLPLDTDGLPRFGRYPR